jgi:acid phosphatase
MAQSVPSGESTQSSCSFISTNHPPCSRLGELTDKGRQTTYALGARLRHLYVDQLKFMPSILSSADSIYLRATPLTRAIESMQQAFWGMYPLTFRTASFPPPTIVTRTLADETLFPDDGNCRRFAQLSRAFAQRAAGRWNESDEMAYLNRLIGKWMPESSPQVAVDSHPRLSGIMDTINSSLAHGPETRLPKEFYDEKGRMIIEKIGVEEWFSGYAENREYRKLGIGGLVGDIVERMCATIDGSRLSVNDIGRKNSRTDKGHGGEERIRFAMSGCHDTTLAALLTSLGAFDGESWPPFTSHVAVEMFRKKSEVLPKAPTAALTPTADMERQALASKPGWLAGMLGLSSTPKPTVKPGPEISSIGRRPHHSLSASEKARLDGYYVRIRYNDKVMTVPGCRPPGRHLEGDESFCTLEAFKRIADGFVPMNWKRECGMNLERNGTDVRPKGSEEWAGQIEEGC